MKTVYLFLPLVLPVLVGAQTVLPSNLRAAFTLDQIAGRNGFEANGTALYGIPLKPGGMVGDVYLDSAWRLTNIVLYDDGKVINNLLTRYDIQNNGLEIKGRSNIYFMPGTKIKAWVIHQNNITRAFVNGLDFSSNVSCFFEVLVDGKATLMKRTQILIKKPDYNPSLDIGFRHSKIIKQNSFYCVKGKEVVPLAWSKKKLKHQLVKLGIIASTDGSSSVLNGEEALISHFELFNKQ
jgi:hypothetical protein